MPIIEITSLDHPGVEVYGTLTEAQLRKRLAPDKGIFIAESPKVIHVALDAGYESLSLLCERRHITGDRTYTINTLLTAYVQNLLLLRDGDRIEHIAYILAYSPFRPSETDRTQAQLFGAFDQWSLQVTGSYDC